MDILSKFKRLNLTVLDKMSTSPKDAAAPKAWLESRLPCRITNCPASIFRHFTGSRDLPIVRLHLDRELAGIRKRPLSGPENNRALRALIFVTKVKPSL